MKLILIAGIITSAMASPAMADSDATKVAEAHNEGNKSRFLTCTDATQLGTRGKALYRDRNHNLYLVSNDPRCSSD